MSALPPKAVQNCAGKSGGRETYAIRGLVAFGIRSGTKPETSTVIVYET
jgi:hypothetical protein